MVVDSFIKLIEKILGILKQKKLNKQEFLKQINAGVIREEG